MKHLNIQKLKSQLKKICKNKEIIDIILFGSVVKDKDNPNDIDIAIYANHQDNKLGLCTDIQILLHEHTGITPDFFDVKIINDLLVNGDLFSLLYLKNIFKKN